MVPLKIFLTLPISASVSISWNRCKSECSSPSARPTQTRKAAALASTYYYYYHSCNWCTHNHSCVCTSSIPGQPVRSDSG